jgi:hypothetical protein
VGAPKHGLGGIDDHQRVAGSILAAMATLEELHALLTAAYPVQVTRPLRACLDKLDEVRGLLRHELLHEQPMLSPNMLSAIYYPVREQA